MFDETLTARLRSFFPDELKTFKVVNVSGRNNKCAPRAISVCLYGTEDHWATIEEVAVERVNSEDSDSFKAALHIGKLILY